MNENDLLDMCLQAVLKLKGTPNTCLFQQVWAEYNTAHGREYHNKNHILHVVSWIKGRLDVFPNSKVCLPTIILAALYHDAVYQIGNPQNEELSAKKAATDLSTMEINPIYISRIVSDIMYTQHLDEPETAEGKYLVDADLISMSQSEESFWCNTRLLFVESGKSAKEFTKGTVGFLTNLLKRPRIYYSPCMYEEEKIARKNIAITVQRLENGELTD